MNSIERMKKERETNKKTYSSTTLVNQVSRDLSEETSMKRQSKGKLLRMRVMRCQLESSSHSVNPMCSQDIRTWQMNSRESCMMIALL